MSSRPAPWSCGSVPTYCTWQGQDCHHLNESAGLERPEPTKDDLRLAAHARAVRVFVYDLEAAGFQPPLNLTSARSAVCASCAPLSATTIVTVEGFPHDLCNESLGKLHRRRFADAYQGNYWGNHHGGESTAAVTHARLAASPRRTRDATEAHLFFIPLETRNMCIAGSARNRAGAAVAPFKGCGVDYEAYKDIPGMWRWLLWQESFAAGDGSSHFMFIEMPYSHMQNQARALPLALRALCCALLAPGGD
jgi:hypothetical protein